MTSPAANEPRPSGTVGFHRLIEEATLAWAKAKTTALHALQNGVDPNQIIDYARGRLEEADRREVQGQLMRSEWAMGRVTALVKARRDPNSLGARILSTTGPVDPYVWGISRSDDPEMDLARLLETV